MQAIFQTKKFIKGHIWNEFKYLNNVFSFFLLFFLLTMYGCFVCMCFCELHVCSAQNTRRGICWKPLHVVRNESRSSEPLSHLYRPNLVFLYFKIFVDDWLCSTGCYSTISISSAMPRIMPGIIMSIIPNNC